MIKQWIDNVTFALGDYATYANKLYVSLKANNLAKVPTASTSATWWALHNDPITQVYNALWSLIESHAPLASMVSLGNRVKFTGGAAPVKDEVSTADLPELRLIPLSGQPHLERSSNGSSLLKRFRIDLASGDKMLDLALFPIEWELYRALAKWRETLTSLKWQGKSYVVQARQTDVQVGTNQTDLNRGIDGWSMLWQCEVELWFITSDLQT